MALSVKHPPDTVNGSFVLSRGTETRAVQLAPAPARIRPFVVPSADQLLQDLEQLRSDMVSAQEAFDRQPELDAERNALKAALATQVAELKAKLASVEAEFQRVESLGSVREEFIKRVSEFEHKTT